MPDRTEVRIGTCPEHGSVEATRVIPGPHWPYLVWMVQRATAGMKPFRCPQCDTKVAVDRRAEG
jgi:hypothetical protein